MTRRIKAVRPVKQEISPYNGKELDIILISETRKEFKERVLEEQKYRCAICQIKLSNQTGSYIDHDHRCCNNGGNGCYRCRRGILCRSCNMGLGFFRDSVRTIAAGLVYLEDNGDKTFMIEETFAKKNANVFPDLDLTTHGYLLGYP